MFPHARDGESGARQRPQRAHYCTLMMVLVGNRRRRRRLVNIPLKAGERRDSELFFFFCPHPDLLIEGLKMFLTIKLISGEVAAGSHLAESDRGGGALRTGRRRRRE